MIPNHLRHNRTSARGLPFACLATTLAMGLLAVGAPASAEEAATPEHIAASFARGLFEGRDADIAALMTPQVKAAMTQAQSDQLRTALTAQNGDYKSADEAWFEDTVQIFKRYRVPLQFANAKLDMRVVLDADQKVAGVFFVPHEPRSEKATPEVEPEAPVKEVEVRFGDPELPGTLSLPNGDGPFPAVILVHGSGPNDRDETIGPNKPFRDLAWGLAEAGVMVLRYDKRSLVAPESLAKFGAKMTVREEVLLDARAGLEFLRGRSDAQADRLFVLGHSLGGTVAPRIAAEEPKLAGIIVLAGATLPLPEKMLEQTRYIVEQTGDTTDAARKQVEHIESSVQKLRAALDGKAPDPEGNLLGAPIGYYRDLEAHDPPTIAAGLTTPALILQGERDYQVTMRDFARWKKELQGRQGKCLATYPALDHLFRPGSGPSTPADYARKTPVAAAVITDIAAWIRDGACPTPASQAEAS